MDDTINRWTIYMYTFPNGKRYIGATTRPLFTRQGSVEGGWEKYKRCKLLYEAIQKYGVENIDQTILFEGLMENRLAAELESFFIEVYKTNAKRYYNPSYGYNQTDGGEGTTKKHISEERREQLRGMMKVFQDARLGSHPTEETRRRQSVAHLGQLRGIMPMETRMKISAQQRVKPVAKPKSANEKSKIGPVMPVLMHNNATGESLKFGSCKEAGYYFGVNGASVTRWIKGQRRPPEGLVFVKESDYDPSLCWDIKEAQLL